MQLLQIEGYISYVALGVTETERTNPQPVKWDITITMPTLPSGCISDNINDTICYGNICNILLEVSQNSYCLIEKLCHIAFSEIKKYINNENKLSVKLSKLNTPITNLEGCATFILTDE